MQKYAITSLIMATIAIPAMATNDLVTETNNGCDNTTLNTYDGDVNLTADWSANTINLTWYNDSAENGGEVHSNTQCTYNSGITLPTAPTRNGYTFSGWRLRQCSLSEYYTSDMDNEMPGYDAQHARWKPISQIGITMNTEFGDDSTIGDLTAGEWGVTFSTGEIRGRALCSTTPGRYIGDTGTPDEASRGEFCWCAGTSFGNKCSVSSPLWVLIQGGSYSIDCASDCASYCVQSMYEIINVRRAIFGVPAE